MSLEGSLETIALPEVLQLLSDTSKSGELLVSGDRGDGRLWFDGGHLNGFDVQRCTEPSDALFELLRNATGRFAFDAGVSKPRSAHSVGGRTGKAVQPILEVAQAHLEEWSGIVAVVPSLDHRVSMSATVPGDSVTLSAEQWSLIVVIGEGRSVGEVLDRAGLSEFDGCRSLKTLVEDQLVVVSEPELPAVVAEPVVAEEPAPVAEPVTFEPVTFEIEEPEPVAAADAEPVAVEPEPAHEVAVTDEAANGVVVSSGEFDGQDFVFKAPVPAVEESYEPQPVPFPDDYSNGHAVYDAETDSSIDGSLTSRAALEALLAEIPADEAGDDNGASEGAEVHDGLADRGPWTSQELASFDQMGGWQDEAENHAGEYDFSHVDAEPPATGGTSGFHFEEAPAEHAVESHAVPEVEYHDAEGAYEPVGETEEHEEEPQPEPVNRGLLLKFLSSVRS